MESFITRIKIIKIMKVRHLEISRFACLIPNVGICLLQVTLTK